MFHVAKKYMKWEELAAVRPSLGWTDACSFPPR